MCAALAEASPLGANNGDVILKAIVLVYVRHHWIEKHPLAATELPAWGSPAMSRSALAVWRSSLHLATFVSFYTIFVRVAIVLLRDLDTWTGNLFRQPLFKLWSNACNT